MLSKEKQNAYLVFLSTFKFMAIRQKIEGAENFVTKKMQKYAFEVTRRVEEKENWGGRERGRKREEGEGRGLVEGWGWVREESEERGEAKSWMNSNEELWQRDERNDGTKNSTATKIIFLQL